MFFNHFSVLVLITVRLRRLEPVDSLFTSSGLPSRKSYRKGEKGQQRPPNSQQIQAFLINKSTLIMVLVLFTDNNTEDSFSRNPVLTTQEVAYGRPPQIK
jgi:hypothetical protein